MHAQEAKRLVSWGSWGSWRLSLSRTRVSFTLESGSLFGHVYSTEMGGEMAN